MGESRPHDNRTPIRLSVAVAVHHGNNTLAESREAMCGLSLDADVSQPEHIKRCRVRPSCPRCYQSPLSHIASQRRAAGPEAHRVSLSPRILPHPPPPAVGDLIGVPLTFLDPTEVSSSLYASDWATRSVWTGEWGGRGGKLT